MTTQEKIPALLAAILAAMPDLPEAVPVLVRKAKELESDIDAALDSIGMCIHVLPVRNLRAMQTNQPDFIFYEDAEFRVRILDAPSLNDTGVDHAAMAGRIALALLAGGDLDGLLADNLQPAVVPEEEQGVFDERTERTSILHDVIFHAPYELRQLTEEEI